MLPALPANALSPDHATPRPAFSALAAASAPIASLPAAPAPSVTRLTAMSMTSMNSIVLSRKPSFDASTSSPTSATTLSAADVVAAMNTGNATAAIAPSKNPPVSSASAIMPNTSAQSRTYSYH